MHSDLSVFINPLTDFGFKYLFGKDADKEFILSFLNSLINGREKIESVEFLDKERKGNSKSSRAQIYDLYCRTSDGRHIIVEMQNRFQAHFDDRALYYLSCDIAVQGEKGNDWQYELTPVYGVFLMNFEWRDVAEQHLREDVCLYNMQTKKVFSEKLGMTFLKIPMMNKDADDCQTTLDRWLYLLKNMETMETMPRQFTQDPVFSRLEEVAKVGALDDRARRLYRESLKVYRDNYAIAQTERSIGIEEGIAIGQEGERRKFIPILRRHGLSDAEISKELGVSMAFLKSIPKE